MLQYVCEWCNHTKKPGGSWILGFAAEKVGPTSARREITIAAAWSEKWAAHPLAVHFCSEKHKENYVRALFELETLQRQSRARTATVGHGSVSPKTSGGAVLHAQDCEPAKTRRAAKRSPSEERSARRNKALVFDLPDGVRAHGLSVRLDDPSLAGRENLSSDNYGGAREKTAMTSTKKKTAKKKTRSAKRAPAMVTEETTRVVAQPTTVVTREPVTLSRVLGERVVAKPVTETEVTRSVRTRRRRGAA